MCLILSKALSSDMGYHAVQLVYTTVSKEAAASIFRWVHMMEDASSSGTLVPTFPTARNNFTIGNNHFKTCRLFRLNVRVYYFKGKPYTHFYSSLLPLPSSEPCEQFLYSSSYLRNICRSWRSQFNFGIFNKKIILWSSGVNKTCNNTMIN